MSKQLVKAGTKTVTPKGVYYGASREETKPEDDVRYMSKSDAVIVDLITEDGIEGLVYQDYDFNNGGGENSTEGKIGYAGYRVDEFVLDTNGLNQPESGKLCSVYWNEMPVLDKKSHLYNFTDIELDHNQSTFNTVGFVNKRVQYINEEIKGSSGDGSISHHKYHKIYNKECGTLILSIKIGALGKVDRHRGSVRDPNENYGKLLDSTVSISFWYRPIYSNFVGSFKEHKTETIKGNLSTPYIRDVKMTLPLSRSRRDAETNDNYGDFLGWEIQIIRGTPMPTTPDIKNSTMLESITEEIGETLMAPKSFLVRSKFDAEYFSSIPDRAFDTRLLKVRVPSNYDPISRTYFESWQGQFSDEVDNAKYGQKRDVNNDPILDSGGGQTQYGTRDKALHWSDNPAWCFYDLITNKRYGLGKYVDKVEIDKWTLYKIAQYCDELVPDGFGGLEPRFTCNILIQTREDAFQVLNDMASVFRAIVYYSSGNVYAVQDSFKDSVFQFTNASVENGDFNYTTTSAKVRHTVAIIRYNDRSNFYKPAVEYIDDVEGIRRYGIKEKEVSAFGCTSRGQAIRLGRWILATERLETETITFTTGNEGALLRPGDVFTISDSNRLMKRRGGRVETFERISSNEFRVLLDSKLEVLDTNRDYQLTLSAPSFFFDPAQTAIENSDQIQYIRNHHVQKFTFTPSASTITYEYSATGKTAVTITCSNCMPNDDGQINLGNSIDKMSWSILGSGVDDSASVTQEKLNQDQRFRVINVSEKDQNKYEVSGAEYREEKYQEIDQHLSYTNTITFNIPKNPQAFNFTDKSREITPNTKAIDFQIIPHATDLTGLSYYVIYAGRGTGANGTTNPLGSGIPSDEFLVDRIYSTGTPTGSFIPSVQANYYFRVYAVNSLGQYSAAGADNHVTSSELGAVQPVKDVSISALRLSDDTGTTGNVSAKSDPIAGKSFDSTDEKLDEFDGSSIRFLWKTSIPSLQAINTSFEFKFRIRIQKDRNGDTLKTITNFRPRDWELEETSFELPLADIIDLTKSENSGDIDLKDVYRELTVIVDAHDDSGTYSSDGSNASGYDKLYVKNPAPRKADKNVALSGFIDINAHIKVFNTDRPTDAQSVYIFAAREGEGQPEAWSSATAALEQYGINSMVTHLNKTWKSKIPENTHEPTNANNTYWEEEGFFPAAFDYQNHYVDNVTLHGESAHSHYAFNVIKITPIANEDPVFEMNPSFKADDMEKAYVAIAYTDDFDEDLLTYQTENEIPLADFNIKNLFQDRISDVIKVDKVTPEVVDLIGMGWKAWIKIDMNGKWSGHNIACIKDDTASHTDFKGYIPFYCGRRIPLIQYYGLYSAADDQPANINVGGNPAISFNTRDFFSASCVYTVPRDSDQDTYYPKTYTANKFQIGGYTAVNWADDRDNLHGSANPYKGYDFTRGFKRYKVYFKKNPNGQNKFTASKYWVVGMNVNEKPYFDTTMVDGIRRLIGKTNQLHPIDDLFSWEEYLDGGAKDARGLWENSDDIHVGGSDAYFNYHPAGFVQGFGGLAKEDDHFVIHMGHMIDNSYLKEAIFFVMATSQEEKDVCSTCPTNDCT